MDRSEQDKPVAVRRCATRRQAEQYALVLVAMGVRSAIATESDFTALYVAPEDVARANEQLTAYESENRASPPGRQRLRLAMPSLELTLAYWAVLLFFFAAARHEALSTDWLSAGAAQAGLMLGGEWWRAVTALCLHVDVAHLLGNLVFGTVILLLLSQVTGAGAACLSMLTAGAAGNILNALVQSPTHTSIGASTAVFAGIGILAAMRQVWRVSRTKFSLRDWIPLAGGATLLVFLGLSGTKTDVLGHILGFGFGIAAGWVLSRWDSNWPADKALQWKCACAAGVVVTGAWGIAAVL